MAILEVEHIKKKFGKTDVLKDISFSLEQGEVLSIIGSSGSGKTTLGKIVAQKLGYPYFDDLCSSHLISFHSTLRFRT